ncbi:hydroxymethylglutaryl-CoA lyase domain protein [Mycobacterium kansasii 732]|nr:hydroxymethylglutaryl-CoA lyase domain protein [Mycobacterium kansasii 732]
MLGCYQAGCLGRRTRWLPVCPGATGNIATEDLVYLLVDSGFEVDVDLPAAIAAAEVAKSVVGHDLPGYLLRAGDRIRN